MAKPGLFVMLAIVIACGVGTIFSVDRNDRPIARIDPSQELTKFAGSSQKSTMSAELLDGVRKAELRRRAIRPAGDRSREDRNHYDGVLNGGKTRPHPRAAEPMPPTYCRSIERAPESHRRVLRTALRPLPHASVVRERVGFRGPPHGDFQE